MPQSIKLTYFPLAGRAEAARLCFTHADIAFEDKRVPFEEWGAMKEAVSNCADDSTIYKLASLPWLEVDGEEISQSMAVVRYAAAVSGLDGTTSLEKAKVDEVLGAYASLMDGAVKLFGASPDEAEEVAEKVMKTFKTNLDPLEKILKGNNDGKMWIVGDSVTVADFAIYGFVSAATVVLEQKGKSLASEFDIPCLMALKQRVADIPKLQDYFAKSN